MSIRNVVIIVVLILYALFEFNNMRNTIYSTDIQCNGKVCTIIPRSVSQKIINQKTINLDDIQSFSYEKNRRASYKKHVVHDIYANKINGNKFIVTATFNKTPYDLENIIKSLNDLLSSNESKELFF